MDQGEPQLPAVAFTYNGVEFPFDERRFINLTAMWKAAGSPENKSPYAWKRKEGKGFIADLARSLNTPQGRIIVGERGKGGATWAHWQISVAYAKYLSHEFHRFVNDAFKEWADEKADPALKMERAALAYQKKGKAVDWIVRRFKGIVVRNELTATMADHNCKVRGKDNPFAEITRAMCLKIIGMTPAEFREKNNLPESARTRDHYDEEQLVSTEWAEIHARKLIKARACDGGEECVEAGRQAAAAVRMAIESLSGPGGGAKGGSDS